jgi:hypothetical protein
MALPTPKTIIVVGGDHQEAAANLDTAVAKHLSSLTEPNRLDVRNRPVYHSMLGPSIAFDPAGRCVMAITILVK